MTVTDTASAAITRYARGPLLGAIAVALGWHVVNDLTGTVTNWSRYRSPSVAVAVWLAFAAVGVLAAANLLRRDGRGIALAGGGIAVLLVAVAAQLVVCPPAAMFHLADWAWSNFAWFAMLLLWRYPLRWLIAAMAVDVLVALAVLLLTREMDRVELARFAMIVFSSSAIEFSVAWGGRALENRARHAVRAASELAEIRTTQAAAEQVHADRQRRYQDIGQAVRRLLAGLAEGRLDPSDPAARRACAVGASHLRRLIAEHDDSPSPLVHELRACADLAERRGVQVSLETVGSLPRLPVPIRRALTDAPMHLLVAARNRARITVIWSDDDREVEVSVVADGDPGPGGPSPVDGVTSSRVQEGDTLWVRTRWRDRSP